MKKIYLAVISAAFALTVFTACSKDAAAAEDCCTLSITLAGATNTVKYCKKNSTTITVSSNGGAATDVSGSALGGVSVDDYMKAVRAAGCK